MVQIIQGYKKPTQIQNLAQGLSEAMKTGSDYMQKKQAENLMREENAAIKQNYGVDLSGIQDPKQRQQILAESLRGQSRENIENLKGDLKKQSYLDLMKDFGFSQGAQQGEPPQRRSQEGFQQESQGRQQRPPVGIARPELLSEEAPTQGRKAPPVEVKLIPQEKIIEASIRNPAVGARLQAMNDQTMAQMRHEETKGEKKELAQQREQFERQESLRKETLPVRQEYATKAAAARKGIENKQQLMDLIEKGDINDPTFAALAEALPLNLGKRMLSNDTVEYKAGLVEEFGDLRNIFQGQTRVKEIELLEQKIADIYLTDDQKKAILKSRIQALKADVIRSEAAAELEFEPGLGALTFSDAVEKKAKPRLDSLFGQILDEQKAVIQSAENKKKVPLDIEDPDDVKIIDAILQEAGGNYKEAERIAKKKGYHF